ncbi:unnamed protein product [Rotaria sordida]|uniref:DH domain-containing protein n=1 Tax=Rotaria sordida TaxID=392033 RepID=A0A814L360_9BILA|nr:unnamed protein product [Rotaria sordida]
MDEKFLLFNHLYDNQAQNNNLSSSINSNNDSNIQLISNGTLSKPFSSNEDIYIKKRNSYEYLSIYLSNCQHEKINLNSSQDKLSKSRIHQYNHRPFYKSYSNYSRPSSSFYPDNNQLNYLLSNCKTAYTHLEDSTDKLFQLADIQSKTVQEKKCDQLISLNPIQKLFSTSFKNNFCNHRSSTNNQQELLSNVNNKQEYNRRSINIPIVNISKKNLFSKLKISRINKFGELPSNKYNLCKRKSMSSIGTLRSESQRSSPPIESSSRLFSMNERRRHSVTTPNASEIESNIEKIPLKNRQKQIKVEVKKNTYNRNIQVKTTQKETICTKNKLSNPIETELTSTNQIQFEQLPKSSTSNSFIQSVSVSVSSPSDENEFIEKPEPQSPTYSSMITNFVRENLNDQQKFDDKEETFNQRPLLDLINEINQRNTFNQTQYVPDIDQQFTHLSPSSSTILPPKQLPSFSPVILHKKYQEPIDRFDSIDRHEDSIDRHEDSSLSNSSFNNRNNRNGVMRSYTFTTPSYIDSDSNQISSVGTTTCQSTPELVSSNQSIVSTLVNTKHNSSLSTSASSLTGTSNPNTTSTSSRTIDDKNEIYLYLMSDKKISKPSSLIRAFTFIQNNEKLNSTCNFYAMRRYQTEPPHQSHSRQVAQRKAIALQMYDTEKSYVEALKNLVTKYYLPMKDKTVVSNELINDIFYKIPEIHIHHTAFLLSLSQKLNQWDNKQTVGDILLQMFTRTSVIETYTSFVNNYKTAQIAIGLCRDISSFNKFLEQQARDHHGKLTLRDLIIQPVQRIPRYELYIKDFLKCTNINHPDYQLLLKAQSEIHSLAEQIDQVQKEVGSTDLTINNNSLEVVQDIIENLTDLVNADRYYIRHDLVTLQSPSGLKKDRCIFLFNDLIIITICKRRSSTLTKKTANSVIVHSPSGKQYIDNAKHKLIMKISLESVDLAAVFI